jgi:RHS repeat-associated protein
LIQKTDSNGTTDYHYDFENRLVKIELPNASIVRFLYSPYGYRLSKIVDSTTTFYVYDFENMIMELDGDGIQKSKYTHGLSTDEPLNMLRSGLVSYYQCDGLGSVTALMDSNENVIATYVYDVFGKLSGQTGTLENPFRFTCREYDSESGLYYYRLRYYDANIGRFTTKDPLIAIDSMSTYVYAKNNPVIYVDPNGLEAKVKLGFEIASPSGTIRGLPQKTSNPLTKPEWIREDTICVYDPPTLELRFYVVLGPLFEKGWLEKRNVKIKEQENCRQKIKYELWMVTPKYDQHIEIRIAIWLKGQDFRRIDEAIQSLRKEVPDPVLGLPGRITGAVASKIPIAGDIYGMVTDCLDILQEADSNEEMNSALDKLDEEMRKLKQGDELEDIAWWLDMWKKRLDPDEDYQETREEIRPCQKPVITPSGGEPQPFREPPKDSPMPKPEITPGGQPEPQPCYFTPIVNPGIVALIPSESTVDATILNGGDSPQNVTVSVSYTLLLQSDPPIGTQTATLQLGANGTLTFPWAPPYRGLYEIKAEVLSLPDEFDTADNTRTVQISVSHIGSSQSDAPILNWAILTFGLVSAGAVFPSRKRRSKVLGWISGVVDIATSSLVAVPSPPNNRPNYHYTTNDSTHRLLRAQTNCSSRMDLCAAHGNTSMPAPTLQPSIPTYL